MYKSMIFFLFCTLTLLGGCQSKTTKDGYPLPFKNVPITKNAVVVLNSNATLKKYPKYYEPEQEKLGPNEMRLVACGTGNPAIRVHQAAPCWLIQLGNGDNFIFDVGGGSVANLLASGLPPAKLDTIFLSHLHLDHIGGLLALYDTMVWARTTPLYIWGAELPSKPSVGVVALSKNLPKLAAWHIASKSSLLPIGDAAKVVPHPIDYSKFSKSTPRQLVYNRNGVKIYAFPVIHDAPGALGYRLEWNGLSMAYTGDSEPSTFEAEQAKGVDVFVHEGFVDAATFARYYHLPLKKAQAVESVHTTAEQLGKIFALAQPKLGVAFHYFLADDTIDPFFAQVHIAYKKPVVLAQDFTAINVTPNQIVTRMTKYRDFMVPNDTEATKDIAEADVSKSAKDKPAKKGTFETPQWLRNTRLN